VGRLEAADATAGNRGSWRPSQVALLCSHSSRSTVFCGDAGNVRAPCSLVAVAEMRFPALQSPCCRSSSRTSLSISECSLSQPTVTAQQYEDRDAPAAFLSDDSLLSHEPEHQLGPGPPPAQIAWRRAAPAQGLAKGIRPTSIVSYWPVIAPADVAARWLRRSPAGARCKSAPDTHHPSRSQQCVETSAVGSCAVLQPQRCRLTSNVRSSA